MYIYDIIIIIIYYYIYLRIIIMIKILSDILNTFEGNIYILSLDYILSMYIYVLIFI